jgi:hypothetical protein
LFKVAQKPIIDQIKSLRAQILKDVLFSATARKEDAINTQVYYIFSNKRKAKEELERLSNIVKEVFNIYMLKIISFILFLGLASSVTR